MNGTADRNGEKGRQIEGGGHTVSEVEQGG